MKSTLLLWLPLMAGTIAAPTAAAAAGAYEWTPALADYFDLVSRHIKEARSTPTFPDPPACDLSKAAMPTAPTPLPSPAGLTLSHVAIGRGVQNYTCASADANTVPAAVGAIASLYNASCVASLYPDILSRIPNLALQYPVPVATNQLAPSNMILTGHHYFATTTTPVFNLEANPAIDLGVAFGKKVANSTAPADAPKGQNGVGDGSVAWLYLTATNATVGNIKAIYRLNTAGGSPPKDCSSSPAAFSVQYAAEYWFYE